MMLTSHPFPKNQNFCIMLTQKTIPSRQPVLASWASLLLPAIVFFLGLMFTSCEKDALIDEPFIATNEPLDFRCTTDDCLTTVDFLAGQHTKVGTITAQQDGNMLTVTYNMSPGYFLTEVHLHVAIKNGNTWVYPFPTNRPGLPIPGRFDFGNDQLSNVSTWSKTVDLTTLGWISGYKIYVAAHGVVSMGLGSTLVLPSQIDIKLFGPGTVFGAPSYLDVEVLTEGVLKGWYDSYCIDTDRSVNVNNDFIYKARVHFSDSPEAAALVEYPENLDLVNFILNQNWVGKTSPSGGKYTYGDVQWAIWTLIEDEPCCVGYNIDRVNEILAHAQAHGEGYEPKCGELLMLVLEPFDPTGQTVVVPYPVPCGGKETAWGKGTRFVPQNWSMYFQCL
jgi:hypothetical protein